MNTPEKRKIYIHPVPASRPRVTKKRAYTEPKYATYKTALTWMLKGERIPKQDYESIKVKFGLPYAKGTTKKNMIDLLTHRKRPDIDNLMKGFMDALEQAGIIENDSQISNVSMWKVYTIEPTGFIEFEIK